MKSNDRRGPYPIEQCLEWRHWVTPKLLKSQSVHRWFTFPHSFTGELVGSLIDEWGLDNEDRILDPFVGAGTTLVVARARGIPATGYDLSPLSVLCSKVKVSELDPASVERSWKKLDQNLSRKTWPKFTREYPELVLEALPGKLLDAFDYASRCISELECARAEKELFRLALLGAIPTFSRAEASGGWLKWVTKRTSANRLGSVFSEHVRIIVEDLKKGMEEKTPSCKVLKADARMLPVRERLYSAVITSPPYPNRHDYTRVFGVELMFGFYGWDKTRDLRYQTFHSHPEAKPVRIRAKSYKAPSRLSRAVKQVRRQETDPRISRMLDGYFLDMHLCLKEIQRVTKKRSPIALVLGNAQFAGIPIPVDELTAEIGENLGLRCAEIRVVRLRGNSAQQMASFGRRPSRESIVVFERL